MKFKTKRKRNCECVCCCKDPQFTHETWQVESGLKKFSCFQAGPWRAGICCLLFGFHSAKVLGVLDLLHSAEPGSFFFLTAFSASSLPSSKGHLQLLPLSQQLKSNKIMGCSKVKRVLLQTFGTDLPCEAVLGGRGRYGRWGWDFEAPSINPMDFSEHNGTKQVMRKSFHNLRMERERMESGCLQVHPSVLPQTHTACPALLLQHKEEE